MVPPARFLNHSLFDEQAYSQSKAAGLITSWPWQQLVLKVAYFEYLRSFDLRDQKDLDIFVVEGFFRPELRELACHTIQSAQGVICNQAGIAYLVSEMVRLGATGADRQDDHHDFGELLLAANDILYPAEPMSQSGEVNHLQQQKAAILTNSLMIDIDPPRHALPRYYYLLNILAHSHRDAPGAIDIREAVGSITGLTLGQVFGLCLALFGYFTTMADRTRNAWATGNNDPLSLADFILSQSTYLHSTTLSQASRKQALEVLGTNPTTAKLATYQ